MKTFSNLPIGGKIIEEETTSNWDIVTVHYTGFIDPKYRAVRYDDLKVITQERTFNTKEMAKAYIAKQS